MAENFLTHKLGELPVWGWGLAGLGGVGIAIYVIKSRSTQAIPGGQAASNTTAGTVSADQTGFAQQAGQITPGTPFPTVPGTGGSSVPVFPGPGWTPIFDGNGNLIGWNPPGGTPGNGTTPPGGGNPPTTPQQPLTKNVVVRAKTTTGPWAAWDAKFPGPPVRPAPNQSSGLSTYAPFGSSLTVLPTPVNGGSNGQSSSWYQLQSGGFIAVSDTLG